MRAITQFNAPGDGATRTFCGSREYRRSCSGINDSGVRVVAKSRTLEGRMAVVVEQRSGSGYARIYDLELWKGF